MRRFKTFVTMAIVALVALTSFTSCDKDTMISQDLDGIWRGNMYIQHRDQSGRWYEATDTEIEFCVNGAFSSSGDGYWVDYYSGAPWDYIYNRIHWSVNNGNIHVHFVQENTDIVIYDYTLGSRYFDGTLQDNGRRVDFQLNRITAPRYGSWNDYSYWDGYYYYSKGSRSAENDSVPAPMPQRRIHIGNRE